MSVYVAETDQQAREECEEGVWYFLKNCLKGHLRKEGRQLTYGPGVPYIPAAAWREYMKDYKPGASSWATSRTGKSSKRRNRSSSAVRRP